MLFILLNEKLIIIGHFIIFNKNRSIKINVTKIHINFSLIVRFGYNCICLRIKTRLEAAGVV